MNTGKNVLEMVENYNAIRKEMMKKLEDNFSSVFEEFFDEVPEIQYITWAQWVPGFNDGDPCTFTMGDFNFIMKDTAELDDLLGEAYPFDNLEDDAFNINNEPSDFTRKNYPEDANKWDKKFAELGDRGPIIKERVEYMNKVLNGIPAEIYEHIFGSYTSIVVEKGKTHTTDYDCGW